MKKFLTFHGVNGDTILVRQDAIQGAYPTKLPMPTGEAVAAVTLYLPGGGIAVTENIEQVEAMLTEPDFTP